jgi:hypothetical protein
MAAANTFEYWKSNWEAAFTPEAFSSIVSMQITPLNRTFVRVPMMSKGMMKTWFDLLRQNHPRLIVANQMSTLVAGPCTLYMCFLTSNHADIRDPTGISSIVPMYANAPHLCFQGLMGLNKTFVGGTGAVNYIGECLSLLILSAKMAPRDEKRQFEFIFISPTPSFGKELRRILDKMDISYNRCVAGTLLSVFGSHVKLKCTCNLMVSNYREAGIFKESQSDELTVKLPSFHFKGVDMGLINLPWATGHSFDIIKQVGWVVEDEGVAATTKHCFSRPNAFDKKAQECSFLSVLAGIDGIHTLDFVKFVTLDPLEEGGRLPSEAH